MTPGRAALLELTPTEIRRRTDAPLSTIKAWRSGARTPGAVHRIALACWFGIPLDAWGDVDLKKDAFVSSTPFKLVLVPRKAAP